MKKMSAPRNGKRTRRLLSCLILLAFASVSSPIASAQAVLDFDGDGKTDYAVIRYSNELIHWHVSQSSGGSIAQQFGISAYCCTGNRDTLAPADYDGDGTWDIAVARRGDPLISYVLHSVTHTFHAVPLYGFDNTWMTQDFDGDGKADPAEAHHQSDGSGNMIWRIRESKTGALRIVHFGRFYTDTPIRGDFDGDGKADIAVYRHSDGQPANTFFILNSSDGAIRTETFGNADLDWVIDADFDGDGKTDIAVWRGRATGTNGYWYWLESSTGEFRSLAFGIGGASDFGAPGDYDGDGKTDQAVARYYEGNTYFYVNRSTGGISVFQWGLNDIAVAGMFAQYW